MAGGIVYITLEGTYCGIAPGPAELLGRWNPDPVLLISLVGLTVLLRHSRPGIVGVAVLFIAFVSPLCALSSALFSARVVHHVLMVAVAAPLLAAALPGRRKAGSPGFWLALSAATLWLWHVPDFYDAALSHKGLYWVMQLSLLGTAVGFWHAVARERTAPVTGVLMILGAFMLMGLLGALLTLAPVSLYAAHAQAPWDWGLSPLTDQQLGGLIMWVPAGIPYAIMIARRARAAWRMAETA